MTTSAVSADGGCACRAVGYRLQTANGALLGLAMLAGTACGDFYDAATSLAADLHAQSKRVSRGGSPDVITFQHLPDPKRGGCADAYKAQFSAAAGMVVWCYAPGSNTQVVSSHITTSHLPSVDVPRTIIVDKARGEALSIELTRSGNGKPALTRAW
jgi:hypothetical protein